MPTKRNKTRLDRLAEQNRLRKAADLAQDILEGCGLLVAPVEPELVAAREPNLQLVGADFRDSFDGQIEYHRQSDCFLLFYNTKYDRGRTASSHDPRTRFSIAHELGHLYLPAHRAWLMREGKIHTAHSEFASDNMAEREADAFAAGMLLPERLVRPLVNEEEPSLEQIERVAERFQTSRVATAIRSVQLSDYYVAVVGLRGGSRAWAFHSEALIELGCYPAEKWSGPSASASQSWKEFAVGMPSRGISTAYGGEWFRTYDRNELNRITVIEHYLPVPAMDTLVVLLVVPGDEAATLDDDD